ncbi:hypothetical protein ACQ7N0_23860 [Escherichia coli]|uniref:hypothetical protein n=1 Tax=Escherichia coli TaxID=562 RepID=UPI003B6231EF
MTSKQVSYKCYCPLCGRKFSAKAAWKHINDYHPKASERELMMIRDVKREKISFATKPLNANKTQYCIKCIVQVVQIILEGFHLLERKNNHAHAGF